MENKHFKTNFKLGSLNLANNIFYAPLAGCSDLPFRKMSCHYRPGLIFCEMVKMEGLIRPEAKNYKLLDYEGWMHPIGAQICGSNPKLARVSAQMIEDLGFDVIDLNCGCPVDKVTKDGSGSGMLRTPGLIGEMLKNMVDAVNIPVTVKIRAGWDEQLINAAEVTQIAEQAGAKAITIHGRTRKQAYKGPANWDYIKDAKEAAKDILVIGNGDIHNRQNAIDIFEKTGCDGVLIARGTLGRPWAIEEILGKDVEKSPEDIKEVLLDHFSQIINYQSERKSILDMRRVGCWYLRQIQGVKKLRSDLNHIKSTDQGINLLKEFDWGSL